MRVTRIYSPAELNRALNRPDVLATLAPGYERFDLTEFVENCDNLALRHGDAVAIFPCISKDEYESHYLFPGTCRGARAVAAGKKILHALFTSYGARAIWGRIPRQNRAARIITRRLGFELVDYRPDALGHECAHYILERHQWAAFSD